MTEIYREKYNITLRSTLRGYTSRNKMGANTSNHQKMDACGNHNTKDAKQGLSNSHTLSLHENLNSPEIRFFSRSCCWDYPKWFIFGLVDRYELISGSLEV